MSAAETISAFYDMLPHIPLLGLLASGSPAVRASGPLDAPVMLVGEAPGEQEVRRGAPFVGPAGKFLDEMLAIARIPRAACYITNAVPFRPPGNRTPQLHEIDACRPRLEAEITAVCPLLVVALGATAWKALASGLPPVGEMHGRIVKFRNDLPPGSPGRRETALFCSFHPAAALRDAVADRMMREDFASLGTFCFGKDGNDGSGS